MHVLFPGTRTSNWPRPKGGETCEMEGEEDSRKVLPFPSNTSLLVERQHSPMLHSSRDLIKIGFEHMDADRLSA